MAHQLQGRGRVGARSCGCGQRGDQRAERAWWQGRLFVTAAEPVSLGEPCWQLPALGNPHSATYIAQLPPFYSSGNIDEVYRARSEMVEVGDLQPAARTSGESPCSAGPLHQAPHRHVNPSLSTFIVQNTFIVLYKSVRIVRSSRRSPLPIANPLTPVVGAPRPPLCAQPFGKRNYRVRARRGACAT